MYRPGTSHVETRGEATRKMNSYRRAEKRTSWMWSGRVARPRVEERGRMLFERMAGPTARVY